MERPEKICKHQKKKTKKAFSFIGCALLRNKWQTDNLMTAINIRVNDYVQHLEKTKIPGLRGCPHLCAA